MRHRLAWGPLMEGVTALRRLRLGFLPLTDAAPLVAAQEMGLFSRHRLQVQLCREVGWATIREKLIHGELHAAAALAPMLWAIHLGIGCAPCPVHTRRVLSANGTALTLARTLGDAAWDPGALRALARARQPSRPLTFGIVFRFSSHHLLLRRWLSQAGLDPERDVRLVTVPPAQMYRNLAAGTIDGYAAGEPWNTFAVQRGTGVVALCGPAAATVPIEKVLAVTDGFARARADDHRALLAALAEAAAWCDEPAHRPALATMLAGPAYLNVPPESLRPGLEGPFSVAQDREPLTIPDFHVFQPGGVADDVGHAARLQEAMVEAGLIAPHQGTPDLPGRLFQPA